MIAEIYPEHYDVHGRRVLLPGTRLRRMGFRPSSPMGSNLTQPLKTECKDFAEMRKFLFTCRWQDMGHTRKHDHWQPPEEFEKTRVGDCVDFALWGWRQVLNLGYPARFVGGKSGKFGAGHAWVMFERGGKWHLWEPQARFVGLRLPRISTLRYHPKVSVAWDGKKIQYFEHEDRDTDPPLRRVPGLIAEWILICIPFWIRVIYRLPLRLVRWGWAKFRRLLGAKR